MKRSIWALAALLAGAANAQNYTLDVAFDGIGPSAPVLQEITGSFTYANGQITNLNMADPGWGNTTQFTVGEVSMAAGGQPAGIEFVDLEGAPTMAAAGSNVWTFGIGVSNLGSADASIGDASYWHNGPMPASCGPDYEGNSGFVSGCSVKSLTETQAPEMGASGAAGALALLFGSIAVLKGRKRI